jgi:hypothetical protein
MENACANACAGGTVSSFDAALLIVRVAEVGAGARTASLTGIVPTAAGMVRVADGAREATTAEHHLSLQRRPIRAQRMRLGLRTASPIRKPSLPHF